MFFHRGERKPVLSCTRTRLFLLVTGWTILSSSIAQDFSQDRRLEDSRSPEPAQAPTDMPPISVSSSVSFTPSALPTTQPTTTPQPTRTSLPSLVPSFSQSPSVAPSYEPTDTLAPSPSPSSFPTLSPTTTRQPSPSPSGSIEPSLPPSESPTSVPSISPTNHPTIPPSSFPSSAPTIECHDRAEYRSPINDFQCHDHVGTDCTMWRYLGLNTTELQKLIESCPLSCQIDCDSFSNVEVTLTLVLLGLSGLLDANTVVPLENLVESYMQVYVEGKKTGTTLELTDVVLKSQALLDRRRALGREPSRRLASSGQYSSAVIVTLDLFGFSVGVDQSLLQGFLHEAVDTEGFSISLRNSHSFFAVVEAVSEQTHRTIDSSGEKAPSDTGPSAGVITVSVLAALAAVGLVAAGLIIYQRKGGDLNALNPFPKKGEPGPEILSPPESELGSPYSFTHSPASSAGTQQQNSSYVSRLLRSLSPRSSGSDGPGTTAENTHPSDPETPGDPRPPHPLDGIIPPMIVIDNIDGDQHFETYNSRDNSNGIVPIKHVEASRGFTEALNTSFASESPAELSNMLYDYASFGEGRDGGLLSPKERALTEIFTEYPFDDEASVSSTPIKSTEMSINIPIRRTLSDGSIEELDGAEVLEELMRTEWEDFNPSDTAVLNDATTHAVPTTPQGEKSKRKKNAITGGKVVKPFWRSIAGAKSPRRKIEHAKRQSFDDAHGLPLARMTSSLSPIRKHPQGREESPRMDMPVISTGTFDVPPIHPKKERTSRSDIHSSHERIPSDEIQYTFRAPTNAKLGLVIESSLSKGSFIRSVKDYSPLLGLIQVGDKIIMVDGVSTLRMKTNDLVRLLGRKRGTIGTIQIGVARTLGHTAIPTLPLARGHTQSDSGSLSLRSLGRLSDHDQNTETSPAADSEVSW